VFCGGQSGGTEKDFYFEHFFPINIVPPILHTPSPVIDFTHFYQLIAPFSSTLHAPLHACVK